MKTVFLILSLLLVTKMANSQSPIYYEAEAQLTGTNKDLLPFWMRSNQYGSIPSRGVGGSLSFKAHKDYDSSAVKTIMWGFGFNARGNTGEDTKAMLVEAFAKVKFGPFQLKIGRSKDQIGLVGDSSLTSGSFSISGNALGIPKVELSIPEYLSIPTFGHLVSFKGTFAHGWLGNKQVVNDNESLPINEYLNYRQDVKTYYHQKSLYVRLGKPSWNFNLYGGFNHQVFWGNEKQIYGTNFDLSPVETLFYVTTGKAYGGRGSGIPRSKLGNQLGSVDLGFEFTLPKVSMMFYRQNFYDVGALAKLANLRDGLNGIVLRNTQSQLPNQKFFWKKILFEFLYTKNQAGEVWSKPTKSGDENYYNNFLYINGWTYKAEPLGNPLLTPSKYGRSDLASDPENYFINNRVIALHLGTDISFSKWEYVTKLSFSKNFGTYKTSKEGSSMGEYRSPPRYGIFEKAYQFSGQIDATKELKNGIRIGYQASIDRGKLLENSVGFALKFAKGF